MVKVKPSMAHVSNSLDNIVNWICPFVKSRSAQGTVAKIFFAASTYFIWQERNARLFKKKKRTYEQVSKVILATVRLKLLTFRFKRTSRVERLLAEWNLPTYLIMHSLTYF